MLRQMLRDIRDLFTGWEVRWGDLGIGTAFIAVICAISYGTLKLGVWLTGWHPVGVTAAIWALALVGLWVDSARHRAEMDDRIRKWERRDQ